MRLLEFEYRINPTDVTDDAEPTWRTVAERPREGVGSVTIEGLDLGVMYDVRARYVDSESGAELSAWSSWPGVIVEKDAIVPPAVSSLRLTKENCLTWEMPAEILDLRGFYIRHAVGVHGGWVEGWGTAEKAHEEIVGSPPFIMCRIPKGRRTILIRPVDWDDNLGDPIKIVTDRGALDDRAEYDVRTVDEADGLFAQGTLTGGTAGSTILADLDPTATGDQPAFPSGNEPWMSADPYAPALSLDDEAPAFGETWGLEAPWLARDGGLPAFGGLYQWVEYVWPFTVHSGEGGPRAVLSMNCVSTGVAWRIQYREWNSLAWMSDDPYADAFDTDGTADAFPAQDVKPWRPWPGRLAPVAVGRYDFRLIVPGGFEQWEITELSVTVSSEARVRHVLGLEVPALGGTRVPPGDEWRKIVEVGVVPVSVTDPVIVPVSHKSGASGPAIKTHDLASGAQVTTVVDATIRGY